MLPTRGFGRSSLGIYTILQILFSHPVSANTQVDTSTGACRIIGDPDVYGKGIRLSYYLQWASVIIGLWIAPESANRTRVATSVVTLSVFVNSIRGADVDHSLIVVEWYIVQYLVFWLLFWNFPTSIRSLKANVSSMAVVFINWTIAITFQVYVYWRGVNNIRTAGCDPKIFLFAPIHAYNPKWILASKVLDTIGVTASVVSLLAAIAFLVAAFTEAADWEDEPRAKLGERAPYAAVFTFMLMLQGAFAIAFVEKTVQINQIEFPGASLHDSGQLIPLLIGIFSLASVFWEGLQNLARQIRSS